MKRGVPTARIKWIQLVRHYEMNDIAIDDLPAEPRKRPSSASILLPPMLFFGDDDRGRFHGRDTRAIEGASNPLPELDQFFSLPLRRWPNGGPIVAVLLCFLLVGLIPQ
jgi:hypothetical protein